MTIHFRIRFPVQDAELSALHAWAFTGSPPRSDLRVAPWRARLDRHSVTWVGAFDGDVLIGFVHACWDGGEHAFLLDTVVAPTHRHHGVGTMMVRLLIEHTTRSGCTWLHVDHEPPHELLPGGRIRAHPGGRTPALGPAEVGPEGDRGGKWSLSDHFPSRLGN